MNFPGQGYGQAPQQGYGGQPGYGQQPQQGFAPQGQMPQQPQGATQTVDEYWAQNSGGGGGAPSYDFTPQAPRVMGTIVDMKARQRTEMGTGALKFDKNGKPQMHLEVTLQTDLRGWQSVKKIPTQTNPQTGQEAPLPPEHDDGKRRIYVWYTLRDALTAAMAEAGVQQPKIGDQLAVQVVGTQPNPKGSEPIKVYKAWIQPGSPDAQAFFGQGQAAAPPAAAPAQQQFQQAAAPQQGFQAPPAQQQFAQQAPPPQAAPPAQPGWDNQPQGQFAPAQAQAAPPAAAPQAQQAPAGWGPNASQDPPF